MGRPCMALEHRAAVPGASERLGEERRAFDAGLAALAPHRERITIVLAVATMLAVAARTGEGAAERRKRGRRRRRRAAAHAAGWPARRSRQPPDRKSVV